MGCWRNEDSWGTEKQHHHFEKQLTIAGKSLISAFRNPCIYVYLEFYIKMLKGCPFQYFVTMKSWKQLNSYHQGNEQTLNIKIHEGEMFLLSFPNSQQLEQMPGSDIP